MNKDKKNVSSAAIIITYISSSGKQGAVYGLADTLRVIIGAAKKIYEASKEAGNA